MSQQLIPFSTVMKVCLVTRFASIIARIIGCQTLLLPTVMASMIIGYHSHTNLLMGLTLPYLTDGGIRYFIPLIRILCGTVLIRKQVRLYQMELTSMLLW